MCELTYLNFQKLICFCMADFAAKADVILFKINIVFSIKISIFA